VTARLAAVLVAAILWAPSASGDEPRVAFLRGGGRFISVDALVDYQVRVPIHADNRTLVLVALDGEFVVRRSDQDVSTERRRTIWGVRWRLPPGELTVAAILVGIDGEVGRATRSVTVYATR
jgi:hypothetical protein